MLCFPEVLHIIKLLAGNFDESLTSGWVTVIVLTVVFFPSLIIVLTEVEVEVDITNGFSQTDCFQRMKILTHLLQYGFYDNNNVSHRRGLTDCPLVVVISTRCQMLL